MSGSSSAPQLRPYDLAADLASRTAAARQELGERTPVQVVADVFLVVSADRGPLFEPAVRLASEAFPLLLKGRFDRPPDRAVTVYAFSSEAAYDARPHGSTKGWAPSLNRRG